ncbi:helix-turn-helix domain-containing protein [Streptomyces sp. G1]|uniref:helix-turn-helix domain-containing protein n=1 Tax=Streptomyces sp. G1 TaxID=361572 RepID=UPI002030F1EF|nr:helix-turn-helix domain-containing protein [Streptomyces sp. G1]MCM1977182.1 helix-turn-helix domain-containing protein [Streptomyces sp. G1]
MPQRVRVPLRVIVGSYSDATIAVYVKIAALERRQSGCEAGVAYLAGLLGLSRSTVERALTELMRPAPDDDIVELTSQRRTLPGGTGWTAVRRVRATNPQREHGAWVPSRATEALSPRQLRCYAALAYATATGAHVTLGELARVLRHRSGRKAGQPLDVRSVRRILRDLEQLGWISVERRAGYRGRHLYTVHDEPLHAALTADTGEGSGGDLGEGSLTEEHHQTDSPDDQPPTAVSSIRRRREQVVAREPVENPQLPAGLRRPYTGPELSLAPRIWRVLEPVKALLPGLSPWVVRELAREIGRQLNQGQEPERLRTRLEFRYASTQEIRDPGRWLLGAAVVRHGCGLVACESGRIWHTGARCDVCAELRAADGQRPPGRPAGPRRPGYPRPPGRWHECDACGAPSRQPLADGLCRPCRPPADLTRRFT